MSIKSISKTKRNLLRRYPLTSFFVLSYLFFLIAIILIGAVISLTNVPAIIMGLLIAVSSWTPNLAAVVVTGVTKDKSAVKRLFAGWLQWRINAWWYVFGLAPIMIAFACAGLFSVFGDADVSGVTSRLTASGFLMMLLLHTIQGATGEELGWRGFALPGLQKRFSPLVSALILGLIVYGWHGILHLISPTGIPEWQFFIFVVSYSVIITWAYNKSQGSVLIATIFHFSINFGLELVPTSLGLVPLNNLFAIQTAVFAVIAMVLIVFTGKNLTRKREL